MNFSVISPSLSPNTDWTDVASALKILWTPWNWKQGENINEVESWFRDYFGTTTAVSFNSGRSALFAVLKSFDIGEGDEVLVQAFTCVAVPNSVLWSGAKPVYVDIDQTYNMDPGDAEKKITKNTKALIVQHTFGIPANLDTLMALAQKNHLLIIEDCAHSLGATYPPARLAEASSKRAGEAGQGKKVGTFGDAAFFSFGRDKVISSVWGGLGIINDKCQMTNAKLKLKQFQEKLDYPSGFWIFQQLLHPIAFALIIPLYNLWIGKVFLVFLQKIHLLSVPVYTEEKRGLRPKIFPQKYPNALASLLLNQLAKLNELNEHRQMVARYYAKELKKGNSLRQHLHEGIFLRFPLEVPNPASVLKIAKRRGIILGNWYHNIIDPQGVVYQNIGYKLGSCPAAERAANHIINLPTNMTLESAREIVLCCR